MRADDPVLQDVATPRCLPVLDGVVNSVALEPRDKEDSRVRPLRKQREVVVGPVHRHDGARLHVEHSGCLHVRLLSVRDVDEARHVVAVADEHVGLHAPLGRAVLGPGEHRQTQDDDRGVHAVQPVLEPELVLPRPELPERPEPREGAHEQLLEHRGGPVLVGVRQRRLVGSRAHAQVAQLSEAAGQAGADLAQRLRPRELAEQHRDELGPAREPFGVPLVTVLPDDPRELGLRKETKQLTEDARCSWYHRRALLWF